MKKPILLATGNPGKAQQFRALAPDLPFELITQDMPEIEETGLTFIENALIKARHASKIANLPTIADDSGLIVDALGGKPGIYSARYGGTEKLLADLKDIPLEKRTARLYCVLVFLRKFDDPCPLISEGVWEGSILLKPAVTSGFGFEPVFYVPTHHCTAAEIPVEEKMKISHRGKAFRDLLNKHQILSSYP